MGNRFGKSLEDTFRRDLRKFDLGGCLNEWLGKRQREIYDQLYSVYKITSDKHNKNSLFTVHY